MLNAIITEIKARGYAEVEHKEVEKNGCIFNAIIIRDKAINIAPSIYIDKMLSNNLEAKEIADRCISIYEENKAQKDFDTSEILSASYIYSHCLIGMQRASTMDIVKRASQFEGIEEYIYITVASMTNEDEVSTMTLTAHILDKVPEVDLFTLWGCAIENTCDNAVIESFMGMNVLTNRTKVKGASAILNKQLIEEVAERTGASQLVMIPSSIHEILLLPLIGDYGIEEYNAMVKEVNANEVEPHEQLSDRAYLIEV